MRKAGLLFLVLLLSCSEDMSLSYQEQLNKDVAAIDKYLTDNSLTAIQDESGLRYIISTAGSSSVKPVSTSSVKVKYTGYLFSNGNQFDQATTAVTFKLKDLIKGWQVGLPLITVGTKARYYIPSGLAYGVNPPTTQIPSNAILVFDIELVDVIN